REDVPNRVIELPDALEAGGERDVGERKVRRFDQRSGGLRPLRARDRERTGAQLTEQQPVQVAFADGEPLSESGNTFAIDDTVGDQAHRPTDEVAADIPLGRPGRRIWPAALAGAEAGELRRRGGRIEADVLPL